MSEEIKPKTIKKNKINFTKLRNQSMALVLLVGIMYIVFTQLGAYQQRNYDTMLTNERNAAVLEYKAELKAEQ